jgi:hypothetical protein
MTKSRKLDGPRETPAVPRQPGRPESAPAEGGDAVQKRHRRTRAAIDAGAQNRELRRKQEEIWEKAAAFCAWNLPTLWTADEPRQETDRRWIVPIILRYPGGHEGKLGEMAFDEERQEFTLLGDKAALAERARVVAASRLSHGENATSPEAGA